MKRKTLKGFPSAKETSQDPGELAIVKLGLFFPLARHYKIGSFLEECSTLSVSNICQWAAGYKEIQVYLHFLLPLYSSSKTKQLAFRIWGLRQLRGGAALQAQTQPRSKGPTASLAVPVLNQEATGFLRQPGDASLHTPQIPNGWRNGTSRGHRAGQGLERRSMHRGPGGQCRAGREQSGRGRAEVINKKNSTGKLSEA